MLVFGRISARLFAPDQSTFLQTGCGAMNAPNTSAAGPHPSPLPEEEGGKTGGMVSQRKNSLNIGIPSFFAPGFEGATDPEQLHNAICY
ncbi:MAG: hypothetical protein KA752_09370 [Giesbergeria sp.]|nr:hypothetical protein [Giesbergeria sp.]